MSAALRHGWILAAVLCLRPAVAQADQDPASLELKVAPCLSSAEGKLREILFIEMSTLAVIDAPARGADLTAWAMCEGEGVVLLLWRHDSGEVLEEQLPMVDPAAEGTARTVALALAELIGATRPAVEEDEGAPAAESPPSEGQERPPSRGALSFAALVRLPVGGGPAMGGLALEASYRLRPWLRLVGGAEWVSGAKGTPLGRIVGTSLTAMTALSFGVSLPGAELQLDAGGRAGFLLWNGQPDQAEVSGARAREPFAGPFGRIGLEAPVVRRLRVRVTFEMGAVVMGSRAVAVDGSPGSTATVGAVSLDRWWATAAVGLSLTL